MEMIARRMHGKDEDEVIEELAKLIKSGQTGLTSERTMELIRSIEPMLDSGQKKKLAKLYAKLKNS